MPVLRWIFAAALLLTGIAPSWAQGYPTRPVRVVVGFPAGGPTDVIARYIAQDLTVSMGQSFIVENRPGANAIIGTEAVAHAAPDGYTLLFANVSLTSNPAIWKTVNYDAVKDFAAISRVGIASSALAIHPSVPAKDLKELMAYAKTKPLNFASPGVGTSSHLIGEMMNLEGILSLVHIPYKGTAPAVADAIGGQLDAVMVPLVSLAQHIRAGKLRGIAVSSGHRVSLMPELPTFVELGFPQVQSDTWYALFAPTGTPEPVLRRLSEASVQALAQPEVIERLKKAGYEPGSSSPDALAALVKSELARWNRMATEAKIPKQ